MGTFDTNNTPISSISTPSLTSTSPSPASTFTSSSTNDSTTFHIFSTFSFSSTLSPTWTSSNGSESNITNNDNCDFIGKNKIDFVNWGYQQIPQNLALNLVGWSILLFIFSILRRKAWNHGHLALLKRISKRGSNQSRGEELLQEEEEAFDEAQQNNAGYNVWVSLFYDPDRRFSIAQPQRQYRIGNANSHPATPTGSNTPTPRGGWPSNNVDSSPSGAANALPNGALSSPLPNGGFSTPIQNSGTAGGAADHGASPATKDGATSADEVKIRIPPHLPVNATPSAATLLRGDGQLHTGNFNFSNPRGFFGWIPPIFKLKDKDYREVSGQDAVNYLNFQRYCIVYLGIVMLMSCGVIMPLNIHGNIQTKDDDFAKTTISNLPVAAGVVWIHAWVGLCYLGVAVVFLKNYMLLLEESDEEAELSKKTVMIRNINPEACARQTIIQHFTETFPTDQILDVQVAHDIGRLIQLDYIRERSLDAHAVYVEQFERTRQRPTARPYCCGDRFGCCCPCVCVAVDAIQYYEEEIDRTEKLYEHERQVTFENKNLGMAFVTFKKKKSMVDIIYEHARMNSIAARLRNTEFRKAKSTVSEELHVKKWKVAVAPSPNNICWENLGTKPAVWWARCIILNLLFLVVMTGLSTPAHIVTLLSDWKITNFLDTLPRIGPVLLSQFLPTWLLWLFAVLLPVLIYYVGWFEGHETKSVFNHSVMIRSYIFLLTMLLFLPSISLTSFETAAQFFLMKNSTAADKKKRWSCIFLAHNGAFFVNYVTTAAFVGMGMELCRFPELFMYSMRLLSARSDAERHTVKKNQPYSYDYGNHYAWFLCIFAITMSYSLSCPLITPIGFIYSIMKHAVDRHNIYFAYDPAIVKKELHVTATNFMLLAVLFTQCNLLFFQLWRSEIIEPLTIFTVVAMVFSLLVFMGWVSWGWFDNIAHNKYKRWVRRFPKQSVNEDSSIIEDSDVSSPADDEDDDEGEGNFVFVPRNQSMLNPLGDPNDSVTDNISMEASSPFSSDVAVRRRTIDRLDSVVSVGSRSSLVNPNIDNGSVGVTSSQPLRSSIATSSTFPDRIMPRPLSASTISTRSSMRVPKLSVTSSLDFDERDEEELCEPGKQRRSGSGMPKPFPSPTQAPPNVCGSLPATPSFAGVTNYGAIDASDYPIAQRPSMVINLELQDQAQTLASPISEAPSPSVSSSSIAATTADVGDTSKSSSSRSHTPAPQNEGFEG